MISGLVLVWCGARVEIIGDVLSYCEQADFTKSENMVTLIIGRIIKLFD